MLYDLRRADVRVKWLVSGLLATLGLSYVFGAAMVALYAGFTPQSVAATYAGAAMSMPMPPETTMVVQRPMSMADLAGPEVHTVDTRLLIQTLTCTSRCTDSSRPPWASWSSGSRCRDAGRSA